MGVGVRVGLRVGLGVYAVRDFVISTKGNGPISSNSEEELEKLKNGPS